MIHQTIFYFLIFALGSAFGSFISVINSRIEQNESGIFFGRSHCPICKTKLQIKNLIPLFSYIFQNGKCSYCQSKIPRSYFYLELISGTGLTLLFHKFFTEDPINWLSISEFSLLSIIFFTMVAIFFYDFDTMTIPDIFSISAISLALIYQLLFQNITLESALFALLASSIFLGGQIVISNEKWLGTGDLLIGIFMALLLGFENTILAIALSYTGGSVIILILLALKKVSRNQAIPFGPFLLGATFITMIFSPKVMGILIPFFTV
jgi:prepilin signal peptidase PulO-like enzyme (type II secretory pathway)